MRPLSMREDPPPGQGYGGSFLRLWAQYFVVGGYVTGKASSLS